MLRRDHLANEHRQMKFNRRGPYLFLLKQTILLCPVLLTSAVLGAEPPARQPVRGVWVANVASSALSSPQAIRDFVNLAHSCHLNTLYVVCWNRGHTTYPSEVMQRHFGKKCDPRYADFDMLAEITSAAHAKQIRVIAWFEFGFSCSYGRPDGGHIIQKYPHWAARNKDGKLASKNNFQWMNAFHPEVQDFMLSLVKEVVEKYPVDGIQGDDRLPACPSLAGYDEWTLDFYSKEHQGRTPPEDHFDKDWVNWRAGLLNNFAKRMHSELKAISSDIVISAAPSIFPWSKEQYLQDWPTWLEQGWVDEVCPQVYRDNVESYRKEIQLIVEKQVSSENQKHVYPGILIQTSERVHIRPETIKDMVAINRKAGFSGEVFFYDAALRAQPRLFQELYSKPLE